MTELNSMREMLISLGLWTTDDERDPLTSYEAATELARLCERNFGVQVLTVTTGGTTSGGMAPISGHEAMAVAMTDKGDFAKANTLPGAICLLALRLSARAKNR